ncbi:aspartate-semialdehyde dehydrogenase [Thermodesulfobium narugense DSM 14796]|uniref:Aspartate-semialdehyde dehydrogenase n=1 Tax=Thermodesulfobium narugense DSM 14796 TaxID=747365 RepID=M1E6Q9_9BACT|nr:aspartate-semialdehyde dehydrogenase [Thermodesulfobium narugense]AEE14283.1 aspartate-semialdehyde dehydrogenase [Thermodesulfobium narugense DSM 14796]
MGLKVAVVGATGVVGSKMLSILEERNFPADEVKALASSKSAGKKLLYKGKEIVVELARPEAFEGVNIALFSAGGELSKELAPEAAKRGCVVIDNSSAWRMDPEVPLVVPEVNENDIFKNKGIIANPNCSTAQLVLVLWPLHKKYGLKRVVVSTYQAVSGAGKKGIDDLNNQVDAIVNGKEIVCEKFPYQIAFNCIPHIDVFKENGYTKEEMKVIEESRKIMHIDDLAITCTAVRVPVLNSHSESVNVELEKEFDLDEVKDLLSKSPGVALYDDFTKNIYPMPIITTNKDETFVGRIRRDFSVKNGLNLWVVSDNLRKGAALNAVQIAESLINKK